MRKTDYTLSPARCTLYCYDGDRVIAEYDGSDNLLRRYAYGVGIDEVLYMYNHSNSKAYFYYYDGLGSVVAIASSSGQIAEKYSYNVFGEPMDLTEFRRVRF